MKHEDVIARNANISARLCHLPRKMLTIPGHDHLPLFVLHELCSEDCFNMAKMAYFVDNPDFNCMHGVAGVAREHMVLACDIWGNHDQFMSCVVPSAFNATVRSIVLPSTRKNNMKEDALIEQVCANLGMRCDGYCSWDMKHANHGLLVYEHATDHAPFTHEELLNGASLLSFCPIV